ncbi:hypothetical protein [Rhodococcus spongiicola]|uniref:Secreted protein n=1 Tax=Rhodococcus spongiicola TaxID=2487352 RepID=A0A3S3AE40_9NOCA|nr:hypothetical protein [Rhodococcus spongiicola]RVW02434.1 hypothetical protein EF834_12710 [Rhodococcus spongiicola]
MPAARMKRLAAGAATTVATVAAIALTAPATASAAVKPPIVEASSSGTTINISIKNPHVPLDLVGCNAMIVDASSVPAIVENPLELLQPGVVVFPVFDTVESLFGVLPGQTRNYTVEDVEPGLYGVVGGCISLLDLIAGPTITEPEILAVVDVDTGSLGSLGSSEIPAFGS